LNFEDFLLEREKRLIHAKGFLPYCQQYCRRNSLTLAKHHNYMAHKLEIAMTTPNYRLMIKMPPGHAKSTYASIVAPTYYLGKFPGNIVIMTTHTQDFSDDWGRTCRRIIAEDEYKYTFQTCLRSDSKAVSRFELMNGSKYFGAGIVGNLTGKRANLIIGDDWLRGIKDADSEVVRESIWKAYIWDLQNRLSPGGSIILIGTPWHEDDHFGRILTSNEAQDWDVIELPALIETQDEMKNDVLGRKMGEALWPDYITAESLMKKKNSLKKQDMRMWNSLYQVKPTMEEGDYFKRDWEQYVTYLPPNLNYYGASDYAVTDGEGDYTVHALIGHDTKTDEIYIAHIWRDRKESNVWVEEFLDLVNKYKPLMWAEESGQIMSTLDPYIKKMFQNPEQRYVMREQFTSTTKKTARARSFQAYMSSGAVYILKAPWTDNLVKELRAFPSGKNDDQVDALALIGRMLNEMVKTVEKPNKVFQDGYEAGKIILPGLDDNISKPDGNYRRL
jgi:predicted phage terminase large subunit-like protein